ncbi:NAD(P)H-binding protein [Hymenobacter metallilatus]|uniref:SDR family NAD(P)-dependent oxidoreductase n=1 Tax=Hymenobacter metallilatus TaxID=2493666 RepID=A0A428JMX6_9BACT|nr:NAD(P)H-binding protein [Hymenobacter metallilatus]RSK34500.1 SDR family NAD(P)-dependent oxidoreductase [Hymenobacter metallilatus]
MTDLIPSVTLPTVAVLGCGWLGLPLARALVAAGYPVHGSTTTPGQLLTLRDAGIRPYLLRLAPTLSATDADTLQALLQGVDVLVLNIPPTRGAGTPDAYPALLAQVAAVANQTGVRHILLISSTGVYPDEPRLMRESDAVASPDSETPLLRAEALFQRPTHTIVRLAGLMGPGRAPGRFLAGRTGVAHGEAPVNMIHLQDCLGLLLCVLERQLWGYTFNASAATHPSRRTFYTEAAARLGLQLPTFQAETSGGKQIDASRIRELTGYQFRHDDVVAALAFC